MSQYPPNFSYVEVDKAVSLDSLDLTDGNLGSSSQEILEDLDSGTEGLDLKALVWVVGALVIWQVVWASLISPTKIRVLTPPWIIRFGVWRIERLPLVVKSISLLFLDCSLNLRKIRAVNS